MCFVFTSLWIGRINNQKVICPEGSSPIVFPDENETVEAKEGNLLIFPGHVNHYVPENKCEGRVIIAGNINLFNIISNI